MRQASTLHQTQEFIECVLLAEVKTRHGFKKAFGNGTNFSARQTRLIFHLGGATQPPELLNEIGRSGIPSLQLIRRWHLPQTHELPSGHCNRISRHSSHSFHRVVVTIIRYKVQLLKISINQKLVKLSAVTHISKILAKERGPEKRCLLKALTFAQHSLCSNAALAGCHIPMLNAQLIARLWRAVCCHIACGKQIWSTCLQALIRT